MNFKNYYYKNIFIIIFSLFLLAGCAGVKVVPVSSEDYTLKRRGDILTTGKISSAGNSALEVIGISEKECSRASKECIDNLMTSLGLDEEQKLSTLSELWLKEALEIDKKYGEDKFQKEALNAYLKSAKYAYSYLFLTKRLPGKRALEDRQTQVRDYYNFSTEHIITRIFNIHNKRLLKNIDNNGCFNFVLDDWEIFGSVNNVRLAKKQLIPEKFIPASSLGFKGLRNQYHRDGIGAELVAITSKHVVDNESYKKAFSEMSFPVITAILRFPGKNLKEVLNTNKVEILGFDPYKVDNVNLAGIKVPLAANFSSGYGLWLARSGFAKQSLMTLFGRGEILEKPHVYLLQPYDPERKVIIMLHGLASSPEAWINVANEILGDENLRKNFQIWQIYYPTNLPLALNRYSINKTIRETLESFDPELENKASKDIVFIGHSMGGVLARLLVSKSDDRFWDAMVEKYQLEGKRKSKLKEKISDYIWFEPMPEVGRVIFIATPHKGTPFAKNAFSRFVAGAITLPVSVFGRVAEVVQMLVDPSSANTSSIVNSLNSIANLNSEDPFVKLASDLPIDNKIIYHSIIGYDTPNLSIEESSDGIVPYVSSHLPGAKSEKIVKSGHSVQEAPEAIVEIRRILRTHLQNKKKE